METQCTTGIRTKLYEHQHEALAWMRECERRQSGGVLADAMGMGKTLVTLGLVISDDRRKRTLIVCPKSVLLQWRDEALAHLQVETSFVAVYHERAGRAPVLRLLHEDDGPRLVIATYDTVRIEHARMRAEEQDGDSVPTSLFGVCWHRVVLDEAHSIRNARSKVHAAACALRAAKRWCVTGTPFNNSASDVRALCAFVGDRPYGDARWWRDAHRRPASVDAWRRRYLLLRDKQCLCLPEVRSIVHRCELSKRERAVYDELRGAAAGAYRRWVEAENAPVVLPESAVERVGRYANLLVRLLRLRQACDHPELALPRSTRERDEDDEEAAEYARRTCCALCGQTLIDPTTPSTTGKRRDDDDDHEEQEEEEEQQEDRTDGEPPGSPSTALGCQQHPICDGCRTTPELRNGADGACPVCAAELADDEQTDEDEDELERSVRALSIRDMTTASDGDENEKDSSSNEENSSSKLRQLCAIVREARSGGEKVVVFSQWTSMLDRIQARLERDGSRPPLRIDGRVSDPNARAALLRRFADDAAADVLLLSLKVGGVGLNLTAASHVVLVDPWFNPAAEDQALDRVHRIGQTRPVTMHRLLCPDTIEDWIVRVQARKRHEGELTVGCVKVRGTPRRCAGVGVNDRELQLLSLQFMDRRRR
ncbi:DEAD/SNF2 helicase [uncultured virus]|nr:DEAD/SNF2 helicase [uncultured virus]